MIVRAHTHPPVNMTQPQSHAYPAPGDEVKPSACSWSMFALVDCVGVILLPGVPVAAPGFMWRLLILLSDSLNLRPISSSSFVPMCWPCQATADVIAGDVIVTCMYTYMHEYTWLLTEVQNLSIMPWNSRYMYLARNDINMHVHVRAYYKKITHPPTADLCT